MTANLVGRASETAALTRHLDRLCDGEGSSLVLSGGPGFGKTSLTQFAAAEATVRGVRVVTGRGRPENRFLGHGVLIDVFGGECLDYSSPETDSNRTPTPGQKSQLVEDSFVDCVGRLADLGPLLVVVDDLQDADTASVRVLAKAIPRLKSFQVLWLLAGRPSAGTTAGGSVPAIPVGGTRPLERHPDMGDAGSSVSIGGSSGGRGMFAERLEESVGGVLTIEPLSVADVARLAEDLLGAPPGPKLLEYLSRAHGSPLHIAELCRSLLDEGWVTETPGSMRMVDIWGETPIPLGFRALIDQATEQLPGTTRRLLKLASVLGSVAPIASVAEMASTSTDDVVQGIQPAVDADLVRLEAENLRFRHDLVRDAVYESLPLSARLTAHNRVARRLMDVAEGRDFLAWHHVLARVPARDVAKEIPGPVRAERARTTADLLALVSADAGRSTTVTPETVSELLGEALIAMPVDDPLAPRLLLQKAWAEMSAGAIRAGETAATAVLEADLDAVVRVEALELLAESLTLQRHYTESVEVLASALDLTSDEGTTERLRVMRAYSLGLSGDVAGGMAEAEDVYQSTASPLTRAQAASSLALGLVVQGRLADAKPLAQEAVDFDQRDWGDAHSRTKSHYVLGLALLNADEWDRAAEVIEEGIRSCEQRGLLVDLPVYLSLRASLLFMQGEWADAVAEAETGLAVSESLGSQRIIVRLLDVLAAVAAQRGRRTAAADALMRAERIVPLPVVVIGPSLLVSTKTELTDDPIEANDLLQTSWAVAEQLDAAIQLLQLGPVYVAAAVEAGNVSALQVSRTVARVATRVGTWYAKGTAERCAGIAEQDLVSLHRAVSLMRKSPRVLDLADTLMDLARLAARKGRRAVARDAAQEALETYRKFGAIAAAEAASEMLAGLGTPRRTKAAPRATTGWGSLTRTETTVAELVAEGFSNRQIAAQLCVSHRTVETHISHTLTKLSVRSRIGIARIALDHLDPGGDDGAGFDRGA